MHFKESFEAGGALPRKGELLLLRESLPLAPLPGTSSMLTTMVFYMVENTALP